VALSFYRLFARGALDLGYPDRSRRRSRDGFIA
jgi:hypothetical protein